MSPLETAKKNAGRQAALLIEPGMIVGLGTGSTAYYFIQALIEKRKQGHFPIQIVSSSIRSLTLAKEGGLPVLDIQEISSVDITVDGADEIDPQKRMIKGGGGALLREKILANMSHELVVIVDESKLSPELGKRKLPVEIVPFAAKATLKNMQKAGFCADFRVEAEKKYITDNGNYIIDICFPHPISDPERNHALLKEIPGVIETGFFFHLAGRVITGFFDGQVTITS